MNNSKLYIIFTLTCYVRALLEIIDKGFTTFAIICLSLGSVMLCFFAKNKNNEKNS